VAVLKINRDMLDEDIKRKLMGICPFKAFEEGPEGFQINAACRMCKLCVRTGPKGAVELVEEEVLSVNKDEWRGIAVYVDHIEGDIHPVTYELIGKARELARVINHPVYALFIGHDICKKAEKLLKYGVDRVYAYDFEELKYFSIEPYTSVFEDFIRNVKPSSILAGATNVGRSLAPRTAARFRTGLTADCTRLEMKENTDLVQIRPAFGGNIMARIVTENHRPQFCTVRYKVFSAPESVQEPWGEVIRINMQRSRLLSNIEVIDIARREKVGSISDADVIVAVGRGIKSEKDLQMVYELADLLGARTACTRPLIEYGWFDPRLQIGLSGRTVKPKLIITAGISGSVQFAAGMQNSECIIAINKDPNALIFNIAHHCIAGDLYEIIPELIEKIKNGKALAGSLQRGVI
jgi:electron transfer flavoprotein alpha subunit